MTTFSSPVPLAIYTSQPFFSGFDRSTKVTMICANHPKTRYVSKDPFVSHIFVTGYWDSCDCPVSDLVVVSNGDGDMLSEHNTDDAVFEYRFTTDNNFRDECRGWVQDCLGMTSDASFEALTFDRVSHYIAKEYVGGKRAFLKSWYEF